MRSKNPTTIYLIKSDCRDVIKVKVLFAIVALCLCLPFMACVQNIAGGSTETTNPVVVGSLYGSDGKTPAKAAKVYLIPVDHNPRQGMPKVLAAVPESTTTNDSGVYKIDSVPAGVYNVLASGGENLAYQDSVTVKADTPTRVPADTLKPAGSIRGVIRLQSGDDARKVFILAMGTTAFSSPEDAAGNFALADMAEGKYKVRIMSILDNYGVLDTSLEIRAGKSDSLADTIVLPYTGIPVPMGLKISYDTLKQIITLSWNKPVNGRKVVSYSVYRKRSDSTDFVKIKGGVTDTVYSDSTEVQDQTYEYRVAAADSNASEGTKSTGMSVKAVGAFVLVDSIGVKGSLDNQLFMPRNAKPARSFYVVLDVVDPYPSAVKAKLFSLNGSFVKSFTVRQNNNAEYLYQLNSAIDSQNNIYIAFKDSTFKYDTSGNLLSALSLPFSDSDFVITKTFVQANGTVKIYSFDTQNQKVRVQDLNGNSILTFSVTVPSYAVGNITADLDGNLYVADNLSMKIYKYNSTGNLITVWGTKGNGFGKFGSIMGIVADNAGRLFVNDEENSIVQIFNKNGTFIGHFTTYFNTKKWHGTVNDNSEPINIFFNTNANLGILEGNVYNEIHVFKMQSDIILP